MAMAFFYAVIGVVNDEEYALDSAVRVDPNSAVVREPSIPELLCVGSL